jgi:hypothetical protein
MYGKGTRKGLYKVKNKEKYIKDPNKAFYRSSWEAHFCKFLDENPNIIKWAIEPFPIPYVKPTDNRIHKYYPDFFMVYKDRRGNLKKDLIEIKPKAQTSMPRRVGKRKNQQVYETITYAVNSAKFQAASQFCKKHNINFRLLTEKELFK